MYDLRPVPDAPALRLTYGDEVALIVAELHIGLETTLSRSGAHVKTSSDRIVTDLLRLCEDAGASRLIVAGDFKQTIPQLTWQERREVPQVLTDLSSRVEVDIVLGNHDGELRLLVPPMLRDGARVRLHGVEGARFAMDPETGQGGVGVFHGHAWPSESLLLADELVSAHTHPAVALVDAMGHAHIERCWVRGPLSHEGLLERYPALVEADGVQATTMTIVPPFNPLLGGAAVNVDGLLGPAGKLMALAEADLFLLDGTRLGRLEHLPEPPEEWRRKRRRPRGDEL